MFPVHPGGLLKRELEARGLSVRQFASALRIPTGRIANVLRSKRGVTADTALRLAAYFGNSAQFWMNLQTQYDLAKVEKASGRRIAQEVRRAAA